MNGLQRISRLIRPRTGREKRMVCVGHSHLVCVSQAAKSQNMDVVFINFWFSANPLIVTDGVTHLNPELARELHGHIFLFVGGSAFAVLGLLLHPHPFDFILPEAPHLPLMETAQLLPLDAVQAALMAIDLEFFEQMKLIRAAARGLVFYCEPPPPYPDAGRMLPDVPWERLEGRGKEIAPQYFRYKLWLLNSQIMRAFCRQNSIIFIPCPPEAIDAEGFLLSAYYSDPTHANPAYGALVLDQMRRMA
ncbi:MAG: hypothetical protein PW790_06075 [Parvibaculaceae bacterium]|nr:hypothetical protein [Parvibaculaceae bacterium]